MAYLTVLAGALLLARHVLALPQPQVSDFNPNLAPFTSMEIDTLINHTFVIHLQCGQTLAKHAKGLAFNVSATKGFFEMRSLPGYRAVLDDDMLLDVRSQPDVSLIEEDFKIYLHDESAGAASKTRRLLKRMDLHDDKINATSYNRRLRKREVTIEEEDNVPYNQRMVHSGLQLDTPVEPGSRKLVPGSSAGATVYVVDSGVRISHLAFEGRASNFRDLAETPYTDPPEPMDDSSGHGTSVAGIAAAVEMGTAIDASIVNVKVFGPGTGTGDPDSSDEDRDTEGDEDLEEKKARDVAEAARIALAICDIADHHVSRQDEQDYRAGVINMSFGFDTPWGAEYIEKAIEYAYQRGLVIVASAGNLGTEAKMYPCAHSRVICVGATDDEYRKAPFSNYGESVNLWAPGVDIESPSHLSDDESVEPESGTSFAAAHASGVALGFGGWEALYNAWEPANTADADSAVTLTLWKRLAENALRDVVLDIPVGGDGRTMGANAFVTTGMGVGRRLNGDQEPYIGAGLERAQVKVNNARVAAGPRPEIPTVRRRR